MIDWWQALIIALGTSIVTDGLRGETSS